MDYRHEVKHRICMADYVVLRNRLKYLIELDPHSNEEGFYMVRSLYFDNPQDKALREKIDGVDEREKFRIRCYNVDKKSVYLEKKSKRKGLNKKVSLRLTYHEAQAFIHRDMPRIRQIEHPLAIELYCKMQSEQLRPRTIVQYRREAYNYFPGNVRVTFDTDLRTGLFYTDLFDLSIPLITPMEPVALLEVKYDEFIPDNIVQLLQIKGRFSSSFSKYAACRVFG